MIKEIFKKKRTNLLLARIIRYYIQNTPIKIGRTLLMQMATPLISTKRFIDKIGDNGYYDYDLTQWIDKNLFFFGHYEKKEQELVKRSLRKNSVFLDIGANSGIYSLLASKRCSKVFSFEPDSVTRSRLEKNIKLNNIKNVKVIPYAVSDRESRANFYINPSNRGMNSLFNPTGKLGLSSVKTTTVDKVVKRLKIRKISFVKMDIEGSELNALRGSVNTIERFKPLFLMEINKIYAKDAGFRIEEIYNFFRRCNYWPFSVRVKGKRKMSKREFLQIKQQNIFFEPQKNG